MRTIILASASPRRKELLQKTGLKFRVEVGGYKEKSVSGRTKLKPEILAKFLSLQKAKDVAKKHKDAIIIAADTLVFFGKEILGKPNTEIEAKRMLTRINGKAHLVITGFTIIDCQTNKTITKEVVTKVYLDKLTPEEIETYTKSKEPLDKAGAYAIQELGGLFIQKIEGDFFNVVGLPLNALFKELKKFGIFVF